MPYWMFTHLIDQAAYLGIEDVCLTGGEPLLYPDICEAIEVLFSKGINVSIVSNGYLFQEILYPFLKHKKSHLHLFSMCFSLDGADPETHDSFRQKSGSFFKVLEAIRLCHELNIEVSLKMSIWKKNIENIFEMCVFGLEHVNEIGLIILSPTPNLIKMDLIPTPKQYEEVIWDIRRKIIPLFPKVEIEGICDPDIPIPLCNPFLSGPNIDYRGDITFCCNLSNTTSENNKASLGNLAKTSLDKAFYRHILMCSDFVKYMVKKAPSIWSRSCAYCSRIFGGMNWLKDMDSEWRNVIWNLP